MGLNGLASFGPHLRHIKGILFFKIYFLFILQKYTTVSKFSKTNLLPPWPMAVGANRHGPRRLQVLQSPATIVAHGG
jgi:hypothetical protein